MAGPISCGARERLEVRSDRLRLDPRLLTGHLFDTCVNKIGVTDEELSYESYDIGGGPGD